MWRERNFVDEKKVREKNLKGSGKAFAQLIGLDSKKEFELNKALCGSTDPFPSLSPFGI